MNEIVQVWKHADESIQYIMQNLLKSIPTIVRVKTVLFILLLLLFSFFKDRFWPG